MNKQELRKLLIRLCSVALAVCICIITAINVACAEEKKKEVKLESSQSKTINTDIKGITDASSISLVTDNSDVAGIGYDEMIVKHIGEGSSTTKLVDSITFSGQQLKYIFIDEDMKKGTWVTAIAICAKRKGTANITMIIDNSGVITTQVYHVTVKGTKPSFGKQFLKTLDDSGVCVGESVWLEMSTSQYAKVTMSCNKANAIVVHATQYNEQDKAITKKIKLDKTEKEVPISHENEYEFVTKKVGDLKININVEQDGKTYTRTYKLDVIKYKNPFKSFIIASKDYAKYFDKNRIVTDSKKQKNARLISVADSERMQGAQFKIKWKKGYKIKKITYRKVNEWTNPHTLKKNSTQLPPSFWELYITYSDSKGRTWTNCFFFQ